MTSLLGVGVDVVDIDRLRRALVRRPRLNERLFTDGERAYAQRAADPGARLAARFAAKEAVLKALGTGVSGGVRLRDVEVVRDGRGAPSLALSGRTAEMARARGVASWHLSLSHTDTVAVATVVAESGH